MLTSRKARDTFKFDSDFYRADGRVLLADFNAARRFTTQFTVRRPAPALASELYALFLIDEALRAILRHYQSKRSGVFGRALSHIHASLGTRMDNTIIKFTDDFPPMEVYRGELPAGRYLSKNRAYDERGGRETATEDMILTHIANQNPAAHSYRELFDDSPMSGTAYNEILELLREFFSHQAGFGNGAHTKGETLFDVLYAPSKTYPDSLEKQLQFILEKWGHLLDKDFVQRALRGVDFLREDSVRRAWHGDGKVETFVPTYKGEAEYEAYSDDKDWMPRLVLIAKNAYVWLHQLSKQYKREINRLDQIPDEELVRLAKWGFTGLWLIGLWERSRASERIKQRMGQEEAVASAYSLYSYDIADDLGGWDALTKLKDRAWSHGIRLSADMVPNHMGIDSKWVIEHPDWFLSLPHSPYPAYTFKSENLSDDLRVGIYLEDHYYSKTDAAVVFQRRDLQTGDLRYIYHGNDGTSFPWNDTAQIDYLNAEAREAIIQTILHVARNFPIIRFDAAMTLAKKHVQRLWYPEPGAGGAIPSRAERGISKAEFDAAMPNEFWREVVDRVAAEVPDTLLLAEAFWLLEGYFVRTLGMHRVYNSAFMHMLRDEDNGKYRLALKNTLEFDARILQRYVNFISNPDEKTAVEQFGKDDKYFGVCILLSTLPGLPMFGHGQVEGYAEKYGMEYRRAKYNETPDQGFINYHEKIIFPILHRRRMFAGVENFRLYDFYKSNGHVNEDVFAYSNGFHNERALVVYHNKFTETRGWIKTSAAFLSNGKLKQSNLAEGLLLPQKGYVLFTDQVSGLEYIRSCKEVNEKGLFVELGAYKSHVFIDWRTVDGAEWAQACEQLNGAGVESIKRAMKDLIAEQASSIVIAESEKLPKKFKQSKLSKSSKASATKKKLVATNTKAKSKTVTKKPGKATALKTKKVTSSVKLKAKSTTKSKEPVVKKTRAKTKKK